MSLRRHCDVCDELMAEDEQGSVLGPGVQGRAQIAGEEVEITVSSEYLRPAEAPLGESRVRADLCRRCLVNALAVGAPSRQ